MIVTVLALAALQVQAVPAKGPVLPLTAAAQQQQAQRPLRYAEYRCTTPGAQGQPMPALAFRILDEARYASPSGQARGTYRIEGNRVYFTGGHLDGEVGHDLANSTIRLGGLDYCAPR